MASPKSDELHSHPAPPARTLAVQIADTIAYDIVRGHYRAGEKLSEVELAHRLSVSRGPIRDALSLLERNMLVTIKPRSYTMVNNLTVRELEQMFTFREHILGIASKFAARHRTNEDIEALKAGLDRKRRMSNQPDAWYKTIAFPTEQMWDLIIDASHSHVVHQACLHFTGSNIWANAVQQKIDSTSLPAFQKNRIKHWGYLYQCICDQDEEAAFNASRKLIRNNWNFLKKVFVEMFPES